MRALPTIAVLAEVARDLGIRLAERQLAGKSVVDVVRAAIAERRSQASDAGRFRLVSLYLRLATLDGGRDWMRVRHALVDELQFTAPDGGACGASPPAVEMLPLFARRWPVSEDLAADEPWLLYVSAQVTAPTDTRASTRVAGRALSKLRCDAAAAGFTGSGDPTSMAQIYSDAAERVRLTAATAIDHALATATLTGMQRFELTELALRMRRPEAVLAPFARMRPGSPLAQLSLAQVDRASVMPALTPIEHPRGRVLDMREDGRELEALLEGIDFGDVPAPFDPATLPRRRLEVMLRGSLRVKQRTRGGVAFVPERYVEVEVDEYNAALLYADDALIVRPSQRAALDVATDELAAARARIAELEALAAAPPPPDPEPARGRRRARIAEGGAS